MLTLISTGLGDEQGMSLRAFEAAKACDVLYAEQYTTLLAPLERFERLLGRPVQALERVDLEDRSARLVKQAASKDVGILVGGDALSATTHTALLLECKMAGVAARVIHGSSILTAIGEAGLSLYKFGETVTVPRWQPGYRPAGFYATVAKNRKAGLHTLILLDIGMTVREAATELLAIEKARKGRLFRERVVVLSRAGSLRQAILYDTLAQLADREDLSPPVALCLPGRLNAFEQEFLDTL
ncbi:MAG: diphthine synthase [Candidatus Aenigmarchaeota archaeon]|nr:diphthine synthase [Candidatus Aenigmarchaeota archaeon]